MKKKILLYGVGTYKNRGVEAIIQSTLNQINEKDYDLTIASHDHDYNRHYYNDKITKYIKHYRKSNELTESEKELEKYYQSIPFDYNNFELLYQSDVVKELEESDICISVGGDNYCYDFCTWLYALDKKSKDSNKKTVLWGASLFEEINDLELINNLRNFDVLVIRESLSYDAVSKYVPKEKIIFTPDPAFSLEKEEVKLEEWYHNRKVIALNVSPLTIKNETQQQAISDLIDYILKNTKYSICLLPHVTTDDCNDLTILKEIKNKYKDEERIYLETDSYNCKELKYIISKCEMLIAARTHASIAAYSQSIPTLVIGYSVKAKGIAKDLFGEYDNYVISSKELTSEKLIDKFKYLNKNKKEIKKILEDKHEYFVTESKDIFNKVIKLLEEQEKQKICNCDECIGCGVCKVNCPKDAITMQKNEEGYLYPVINEEKCIDCNLCRKNCPINKTLKENKYEKKYFAVKNKNLDERMKSTSGGVFSVLARNVLKEKGVVYGCEMKDYKASHIRITTEKDLDKIRGSKYIQSSIIDILPQVKEDLENKKTVLFSGTPCQIGAIKAFLKKDYPNLITVSVVCHGILNDKILDKYIKELENRYNAHVENITFRTKENGWTTSSIKYKINGEEVIKRFIDDPLMNLYLKDIILRESCYKCKYKDNNNIADMIIGDYWGIEVTMPDFADQAGVSSLIINSKKAEQFLNKINFFDNVIYKEGNKEEIEKYNPQIVASVKRPKERNIVFKQINNQSIMNVYLELLQKENNETKEKLQSRENQLNLMKNSKRWRVTNKVFDTLHKIKRLGRGE